MKASTLNTVNPDHLTWSSSLDKQRLLDIAVLGGIRLEGLDRMRVTLKMQLGNQVIRHSFDLYNDTQLERFTRKAAERLEVGTSVLQHVFNELTEQLEDYRLQAIKDKQSSRIIKKTLSKKEIDNALKYLKGKGLMKRTGADIGTSGVVGEEINRLLMYIIFTSRKTARPLHVISFGSSGTGKTHLQERVGELMPEEDRIELTTLSENAFYYFGQQELKNKLILIEDLDGAENVLYPLRELMSKRRISKTIAHKTKSGETKTLHLVVEGPVSVAGCTTKDKVYEDNANRSFLLYLDESEAQDRRIMDHQKKISAGKINIDQQIKISSLLQNCQRVLKPVLVRNPYAEQLELPKEVFKPRRTNGHYLALIEAVTFYHQYQREEKADEQTGEIYIETTTEDIAATNELIKEVLLRKSDELSGACRRYLERLKDHLRTKDKNEFTNLEIRKALRVNAQSQKRYNIALRQGYFMRVKSGSKATGYTYEIVSEQEYKSLKTSIDKLLDSTLEALEGGSVVQ